MKKIIPAIITAATLGLAAPVYAASTVASYPAGAAASGIAGSRHNLGTFSRLIYTEATTEICVFCHSPHHTNTANNLRPMWNRGTSAPTSFTAYGATIGGSTINSSDIGSTTLACLSCHDGVTTFDNIVNAPGKGGVVNGGSDRVWSFSMPGLPMLGGTSLTMDHLGSGTCSACHGGLNYLNISRLNVGMNLSNDHPVSVPYNSNVASLRPEITTINSIDLTSDLASSAAGYSNGNLAQNRWAVKGFISDTATIADLLRDGRVECSSCHDPHFRNLSWDEAEPTWYNSPLVGYNNWCGNDTTGENCADGQFLRRVGGNTGSGVCRTCHNK